MDWRDKLNALKAELPVSEEHDEVGGAAAGGSHAVASAAAGRLKSATAGTGPAKQKEPLRVELDKRKGKPSTLITEFMGTDDELKELAKLLKVKCSAGGSSRDGEILIQGDFRKKIAELLLELGYKVKRINF